MAGCRSCFVGLSTSRVYWFEFDLKRFGILQLPQRSSLSSLLALQEDPQLECLLPHEPSQARLGVGVVELVPREVELDEAREARERVGHRPGQAVRVEEQPAQRDELAEPGGNVPGASFFGIVARPRASSD